ncbi:MAG: nuclear transport factor 2 family protein [Pirellulales bacterium]|nr:nuclear transport factor 2 family protein [Pirellulales bacterium]
MTILFESPIPVLFAGIVAAAVLAIVFFNTGRVVFLAAIAAVVALTLLGVAVEHFVVTEREAVEMALDGLAAAMEANDKDAAIAFLSPSATATRARAEWAFAMFEIQQANVSNLEIEINNLTSPPSATARFHGFIQVRDRRGDLRGGENFYFTLNYRKEGGRWLLVSHKEQIARLGSAPTGQD